MIQSALLHILTRRISRGLLEGPDEILAVVKPDFSAMPFMVISDFVRRQLAAW